MSDEATELLRKMERRQKIGERATVAATIFVLAPIVLIIVFIIIAIVS